MSSKRKWLEVDDRMLEMNEYYTHSLMITPSDSGTASEAGVKRLNQNQNLRNFPESLDLKLAAICGGAVIVFIILVVSVVCCVVCCVRKRKRAKLKHKTSNADIDSNLVDQSTFANDEETFGRTRQAKKTHVSTTFSFK